MAQLTKRTGGSPVAAEDIVSADQETISGSGISTDPLKATYAFEGAVPGTPISPITVLAGMAVQTHISSVASERSVGPAGHAAQFVGIALENNPDPNHDTTVKVQYAGVVTLTTAQWDAVAGTSGGLQRGTVYYVSQSTPGDITATTPSGGQTSTQVGVALNATQLLITLGPVKTF
jgi:hypothetical protein